MSDRDRCKIDCYTYDFSSVLGHVILLFESLAFKKRAHHHQHRIIRVDSVDRIEIVSTRLSHVKFCVDGGVHTFSQSHTKVS